MSKKITPKGLSTEELKRIAEKEKLRQLIIKKADEPIKDKFSDAELDKRNQKKFLVEYYEYNPNRKYIRSTLKVHKPTFPIELYVNICRLKNWPAKYATNRPAIVGVYTIHFIYSRYPPEVLQTMRLRNPMTENGYRLHKHFQWLTDIGEDELKVFIKDAIKVMEESKYWEQALRRFAKNNGRPYQGNLFED